MYKAKIEVNENPGIIINLFKAETKQIKKNRSEFRILNKKNKTEFEIKAKDSTSLRATLNSITKLLTVYEKMGKIK